MGGSHNCLLLELLDYKRNGRTLLMGSSQIALNKTSRASVFLSNTRHMSISTSISNNRNLL